MKDVSGKQEKARIAEVASGSYSFTGLPGSSRDAILLDVRLFELNNVRGRNAVIIAC